MNGRERGFLLLTSRLGNPERKILTPAQLRRLADRVRSMARPVEERELALSDLTGLGYREDTSRWIMALLDEEDLLEYYLDGGNKVGCVPVTRVSPGYPAGLKSALGVEAPGCLWAKGDLTMLEKPRISLVGSRDLESVNGEFAREAGRQAALQGFVLVSGNARGADKIAQNACLKAGGQVISVVADRLADHKEKDQVLYLSENSFDEEFSAQRALSRNRVIHALGCCTLVAQCGYQTGGTWDGTVKNLRFGWSPVRCFDDGSASMKLLEQMGAELVGFEQLSDLASLTAGGPTLFDPL